MKKKAHQIHDKFFKTVMADKAAAMAFFETYLVKEVSSLLDFDSIKPVETSYLNKDLESSFSDLVYTLKTKNNHETQVSILLEHKSYADNYTAFQVLEYLALAYKKQLQSKQPLAPIIPLVFYHGKVKWEYKELGHFFKIYAPALQAFIPQHKTQFIDLQKYDNEQILQIRNAFLASALLVQKNYSNPKQLIDSLLNIYNSLEQYLENPQLRSIFVYVFQNEKLDNDVLTEKLKDLPPSKKNNIMSIYDQLMEQGIEKGIEKEAEKVIVNAFKNNLPIDTIRIITGENLEKINAILKKNGLM